jgi:hypothetical protein
MVGIYSLLVLTGLILSFKVRTPWKVLTVRLCTGVLLLVAVLFSGMIFLFWEAEPPTLAQLQRDFPGKRADLETILRMSDEDSAFWRIAPDFISRVPKDSERSGARSVDDSSGMSKVRWDQYRELYARNGIKLGILRDNERDAFIMIDSIGLLNRGHTSGYLFCSTDQSISLERFEPCTLHQDSGERKFDAEPRREAYSFKRVDSRWIVFDQGPS